MVSIASVAAAYADTAARAQGAGMAPRPAPGSESFAELVKGAISRPLPARPISPRL
jgi:hypothetical protein